MRILVVEDEKDLNRIMVKTLSAEGYSVDSCYDGVEAQDYLAGAQYDAVVLDVMMPRMDGVELVTLTVNTAAHTVERGGKPITLSAKEFALLEYMIRNKEIVLSRESIENNLWNYDYSGGSNVVDVYMSYLRRKIDGGFDKKLIHTVWGVGWVLREEA